MGLGTFLSAAWSSCCRQAGYSPSQLVLVHVGTAIGIAMMAVDINLSVVFAVVCQWQCISRGPARFGAAVRALELLASCALDGSVGMATALPP